eukprot:GHVT01078700.1.p1 GENE.GHVT01078700.1~~GHVT01078700.1.p1  ORF type:complete len:437 (+),score=146.66 GHVT01078700.1:1335-2645(+)
MMNLSGDSRGLTSRAGEGVDVSSSSSSFPVATSCSVGRSAGAVHPPGEISPVGGPGPFPGGGARVGSAATKRSRLLASDSDSDDDDAGVLQAAAPSPTALNPSPSLPRTPARAPSPSSSSRSPCTTSSSDSSSDSSDSGSSSNDSSPSEGSDEDPSSAGDEEDRPLAKKHRRRLPSSSSSAASSAVSVSSSAASSALGRARSSATSLLQRKKQLLEQLRRGPERPGAAVPSGKGAGAARPARAPHHHHRHHHHRRGAAPKEEEDDDDEIPTFHVSSKARSPKEMLVARLLKRWWFVLPPWPPIGFDYKAELENRKLKQVTLEEYEDMDDVDKNGYTKVYQISAVPGVFRDPQGRAIDLRPNLGRPCQLYFSKLEELDLLRLIQRAIQMQLVQLNESPTNQDTHIKKLTLELNETSRDVERLERRRHASASRPRGPC